MSQSPFVIDFPDRIERLRLARLRKWVEMIEAHVEGLFDYAEHHAEDWQEISEHLTGGIGDLAYEREIRAFLKMLDWDE